ncbi:ribosomal protein S18-alanine N-acetyltransferase [Solibaculum mannosilyticum]|uniref:Ribosomal-protein-alanine acetyltransferase n=2 Tax=Solibaculum mannosilyticum TaxID=2780922 RepID=A0A7I8D7D6_9FIRM|nr:ribosomal protein S18-alanine N-acetyltransferase [Solibaculum mannosilyticum]BCI61622.1 ribosomal-protein-alanine acetyltransferase [Solibaculum mannosilyticum]
MTDGRSPSEGSLYIVPMSEADIPHLTKLEAICFSSPWSEQGLRDELYNPNAVFLVAKREESILGYLGFYHILDQGDIANVAVFPEARRLGVASSLLRAAVDYAHSHGICRMTLEVRPSNIPALKLYEAFGFVEVGRRRRFYVKPDEDALILAREFSST